jgi:hypothetical protein
MATKRRPPRRALTDEELDARLRTAQARSMKALVRKIAPLGQEWLRRPAFHRLSDYEKARAAGDAHRAAERAIEQWNQQWYQHLLLEARQKHAETGRRNRSGRIGFARRFVTVACQYLVDLHPGPPDWRQVPSLLDTPDTRAEFLRRLGLPEDAALRNDPAEDRVQRGQGRPITYEWIRKLVSQCKPSDDDPPAPMTRPYRVNRPFTAKNHRYEAGTLIDVSTLRRWRTGLLLAEQGWVAKVRPAE